MMTGEELSRWEALIEREAEGEELNAEERAFIERCAAAHPEAKSELQVLRGLQGALASAPRAEQPGDRALIAGIFEQGKQLERARVRRGVVAGGLALAAGLVLWFARPDAEPPQQALPATPSRAPARAVLAVVGPDVRVDGSSAVAGSALGRGQKLETKSAGACLRLDRDVRACLAPGSVARVVSLSDDVVLQLEQGAVVADLGQQAPGTSFALQTNAGTVRAIGTRFGLEIAEKRTLLHVLGGTVEVKSAGQVYRVSGPGSSDLTSGQVHELSEAPKRAMEAVLAPLLGASASALPSAPSAPSAADTPAGSAQRTTAAPSASAESAGDLLARAREQRATGSMKEAARAYRRLISEHPGAAEAHTARVALGQLELSSLGNPAGALAHFSEYLRRPGPLEQEARYGQVRALAALGRAAEERRAIEAFLAKYPKAMQSGALKERLKTLSGAGATLQK